MHPLHAKKLFNNRLKAILFQLKSCNISLPSFFSGVSVSMCNLSGKRVAGCVIWRVNGSRQIYGCGVMRPGRVHSADLRGPCSRLLKTFKSSDLCIGLVGYLETIRAMGLGSKISSFECIWASRKHKKLNIFCLDDPRRSLMWESVE